MFFWPCVAIITTAAIKKDYSYTNNYGIRSHDGDKKHFPFLCSAIPNLDLGILKMLIRICFRDTLQAAVYEFVPGMIWLSASLVIKCAIFTVKLCYLQVWERSHTM